MHQKYGAHRDLSFDRSTDVGKLLPVELRGLRELLDETVRLLASWGEVCGGCGTRRFGDSGTLGNGVKSVGTVERQDAS
jgi:hypothetical protein